MKKILFAIMLLAVKPAVAQFAIVHDTDGYVYVRKSAEKTNNISDTLHTGEPVWCFNPAGNWYSVDFKKHGEQLSGFIYRNRLQFLSAFDSIPVKSLQENRLILQKDSLIIVITQGKFEPTKSKLGFQPGTKLLQTINGQHFFGTDGGMPKRQYSSIEVAYGKKHSSFTQQQLENLFEPNLSSTKCYINRATNTIYLTASNSDGAGAYELLWVIVNGECKKRVEMLSF